MRIINATLLLAALAGCGAAQPEYTDIGQIEQTLKVKDQGYGFQEVPGGPACKLAAQSSGQQCIVPQMVTSDVTTIYWAIAQQSSGTRRLTTTEIADINSAGNAAMAQINTALANAALPYRISRWFDDGNCSGADVWFGWPGPIGTLKSSNIQAYYWPDFFESESDRFLTENFPEPGTWQVSGLGLNAAGCTRSNYGMDDYVDLDNLHALATSSGGIFNHSTYIGYLRHVLGAGMLAGLGIGTQSGSQTTAYSSSVMTGLGGTSLGLTTHEICLLQSVLQQGNNFTIGFFTGTCPNN